MPEEIQSPISIHALREEGDRNAKGQQTVHFIFLSTPSARRATVPRLPKQLQSMKFLSTPSARRATAPQATAAHHGKISIHALREEGDAAAQAEQDKLKAEISIHALREEGDAMRCPPMYSGIYFYPRPPRGGRPSYRGMIEHCPNISIHALREEGDIGGKFGSEYGNDISIHALREEGDGGAP